MGSDVVTDGGIVVGFSPREEFNAAVSPSSSPSPGTLTVLEGTVTITKPDGSTVPLTPESGPYELGAEDVAVTGPGSSMEMKFVDGTTLPVGENKTVHLSKFRFDRPSGAPELDTRTVDPEIARRAAEQMRPRTPVDILGVRG